MTNNYNTENMQVKHKKTSTLLGDFKFAAVTLCTLFLLWVGLSWFNVVLHNDSTETAQLIWKFNFFTVMTADATEQFKQIGTLLLAVAMFSSIAIKQRGKIDAIYVLVCFMLLVLEAMAGVWGVLLLTTALMVIVINRMLNRVTKKTVTNSNNNRYVV